uniref:Uncharacterized protein n=1 Tax=Tanacetum cinerariifolium TaxID=118510 RepID=A0A699I6R2_TANCI|nr:hypothetical protein [Tanacetum cinerariifolium]
MRSEMMDIGTSCRETIYFMYNLLRVSILSVAQLPDLDEMHHFKQQNRRFLLVVLRLELHKASALAVKKLTFGLRPKHISCFSRVNMKSLSINQVICMLFLITRVDENIIDEHYHKFIQVVSSIIGEILSIEARDVDIKLLSAPESNNTLTRCWFRRNIPVTTFGSRHDKLPILIADCSQWLETVSSIPTILSWGGTIRPEGSRPSILLLTVIITVAIVVAVVLVIVGIFVIVVVGAPSIIKLAFVITVTVPSILWGNPPIKTSISFSVFGWVYAFHQDKASSVRVPVANVTLFSSVQLL